MSASLVGHLLAKARLLGCLFLPHGHSCATSPQLPQQPPRHATNMHPVYELPVHLLSFARLC